MPRQISQIVNDQVLMWNKRIELLTPPISANCLEQPHYERPKVIAISAQMGANGRRIGARTAELLNIPAYDRDILKYIAESAQVSIRTIETLDESARNRVEDYISSLFTEKGFSGNDHLRTLGRVVATLWEHGPCVLTGHGCVHLIPRDCALTVRLTAPQDVRIERITLDANLPHDEAKRHVQESDLERETFHKRYFKVHVDDPTLYDLVLNTGSFNNTACSHIIAAAYRDKFQIDNTSVTN